MDCTNVTDPNTRFVWKRQRCDSKSELQTAGSAGRSESRDWERHGKTRKEANHGADRTSCKGHGVEKEGNQVVVRARVKNFWT